MANGNVEGVIGYGRRNFLVPAPRFDSFDVLNAWLEEQCLTGRVTVFGDMPRP